jgi:hypothetical protein
MGWRQIVEGWLQRDTIEGEEPLVRPRRCIERKKTIKVIEKLSQRRVEASRALIGKIRQKLKSGIEDWDRTEK